MLANKKSRQQWSDLSPAPTPTSRTGGSSWLYCHTNCTLLLTFCTIGNSLKLKTFYKPIIICLLGFRSTVEHLEKYLDLLLETISAVSKTPRPNLPFYRCEVFTVVTAIKDERGKSLSQYWLSLSSSMPWICSVSSDDNFVAKICPLRLFYKIRSTESPTQATVTNTSANYKAHNFGLMAKLSRKGKRRIWKSCFY